MAGIGGIPTSTAQQSLQWISITALNDSIKHNPKPILIDLYTNWCSMCKQMDKKTYSDPLVIQQLRGMYLVKFNTESTIDITFNGKLYHAGKTTGEQHELAKFLLQSKEEAAPASILLSPQLQIIAHEVGFLSAKQFVEWLNEHSPH